MIVMIVRVVVIALAAYLYQQWVGLTKLVGQHKDVPDFHDSCRLLPLPTSAEDLSAIGDGHSLIAGGGDMYTMLRNGVESAVPGAFWLVNATEGSVKQMDVVQGKEGAVLPSVLVPHGIHFSQRTRMLYAINHGTRETVEVFKLPEGSSTLHHIASVASPLFAHMTLNDVVEGVNEGEFYATEWLPAAAPVGGKLNRTSIIEKVKALYTSAIMALRIPTTRVLRCTIKDGCRVATSARFVGANGITRSLDGRTFFVNDPALNTITVLTRAADGDLVPVSSFQTAHAIDNMEMDSAGRLNAGSIPLLHTNAVVCDTVPILALDRVIGGREVGCGRSPGGLTVIELQGDGSDAGLVASSEVDVIMHDGSLLSGVSAAISVGRHVVIGSPSSPGVLVCDLPTSA